MTRLLVIGGNGAGMSAASKAKRRAPELEVEVIEAGEHVSYSSCGVPYLIEGKVKKAEKLLILSEGQIAERGLAVRRNTRAMGFNPYTKEVAIQTKEGRDTTHYDKLVIATGVRPRNPFKGGDLGGVFALRNVADGMALDAALEESKAKRVAVVGGGYVGLEMAAAFKARGLKVHLFQQGKRLLPNMDPDMTGGLEAMVKDEGIDLHMEAEVKAFTEGRRKGHVAHVVAKGDDADVDAVLVAVGVEPSTDFAVKGGVQSTKEGYLLVDDNMRTNLHDVWAAGDCVAARHLITGRPTPLALALPANRMGRVAGDNVAASLSRIPGPSQYFPGVLGTFVTVIWGVAFAQAGITETEAKAEGMDVAVSRIEAHSKAEYLPGADGFLVKLLADRDSGKVIGAQMVGPPEAALRIDAAAVAIQSGLAAHKLAEVETAYAPAFSPVWDPLIVAAGELAKQVRK